MIAFHPDDEFHPPTDDNPYWTETCWFTFTVPERRMSGQLYPFFRTSALLRHIDGRTGDVPVVLLYPGKRRELSALSFMGELQPDRDYRPRIYGNTRPE